jgi:hypothetical protein
MLLTLSAEELSLSPIFSRFEKILTNIESLFTPGDE